MQQSIDTGALLKDHLGRLAIELESVEDPKVRAKIACQIASAAKELEHLKKAKRKSWEIILGTLMVTFFLWGYVKSVLDPIYQRESRIASLEAEIGHSQVARLREDVASEKRQLYKRQAIINSLEQRLNQQHSIVEKQASKAIELLTSQAGSTSDADLLLQLKTSIGYLNNTISVMKSSREKTNTALAFRADLVLERHLTQPNGDGSQHRDVFIANRSNAPIDLSGWSLTDNNGEEWPLDRAGTLQPGMNISSQTNYLGLNLSVDSDVVNLVNPQGMIVDSVLYSNDSL